MNSVTPIENSNGYLTTHEDKQPGIRTLGPMAWIRHMALRRREGRVFMLTSCTWLRTSLFLQRRGKSHVLSYERMALGNVHLLGTMQ